MPRGRSAQQPRELARLYAGAAVLVLPSLYESFGLPVLEAMACGTPVVASDLPALRELVGDAGVLVDPNDVDALAEAVHKILDDESYGRRLGELGRRRAAEFGWRRCAEETLAVLERVAAW